MIRKSTMIIFVTARRRGELDNFLPPSLIMNHLLILFAARVVWGDMEIDFIGSSSWFCGGGLGCDR
jgi:hypothetical protein